MVRRALKDLANDGPPHPRALMSYGNSWLETILMVLISGRNNKNKKKSRLVGEPSDRRLSSLVRRALVGLKICFLLNVTA